MTRATATTRRSTIRVWDPLVRTFHWTVALACLGAFLTTDDWRHLHKALGYWVLGAVIVRIVWGFVGTQDPSSQAPCGDGANRRSSGTRPGRRGRRSSGRCARARARP